MQDCAVLGGILAEGPDNINAVLKRFEAQRKPDVHALGTMDHQVQLHNHAMDYEIIPSPSCPCGCTRMQNPYFLVC